MKKEYPTPKVERENVEYAKILLQNFAGEFSEDTTIHLYLYEFFALKEEFKELAHSLMSIAKEEMFHLSLLGQTIKLLGLDPKFETIDTVTGTPIPWTSKYVPYTDNLFEILNENIENEKKTIQKYQEHAKEIHDSYVREVLYAIIEDEKEHLKTFQELKQKLMLHQKTSK